MSTDDYVITKFDTASKIPITFKTSNSMAHMLMQSRVQAVKKYITR